MRSGTMVTWSCRSSPPSSSTRATPGTDCRRGTRPHRGVAQRIGSTVGPSSTSSWISCRRPAALVSSGGSVPSGKLACDARDALGDLEAAAERIGARLERHHHLHHAGLHGRDHAPHVGQALQRLLGRLRDRELELVGVAAGTLDQHLDRRQREVGEEVALEVERGEEPGGGEQQRTRPGPRRCGAGRLRTGASRPSTAGSVGMLGSATRPLERERLEQVGAFGRDALARLETLEDDDVAAELGAATDRDEPGLDRRLRRRRPTRLRSAARRPAGPRSRSASGTRTSSGVPG